MTSGQTFRMLVMVLLLIAKGIQADGDMMSDSPIQFPKTGALPSKFPPDVTVESEPAEEGYYIFESPCRSLEQIRQIQADMPEGTFTTPPEDWKSLPRTRRLLNDGGELHLLALGDSIINDTMRSGWVATLREAYPKATIRATVYVRGGGGCQHYREEERIARFVIPKKPDLVLIGGISQRSVEDIREVIRQLREGFPEVEILLITGTFGTADPRSEQALAGAAHSGTGAYGVALKKLADDMNCAYLDMTTPWSEYIRSSGLHPHLFYRDVVHANAYGEQILSKILMAFFKPDPLSHVTLEALRDPDHSGSIPESGWTMELMGPEEYTAGEAPRCSVRIRNYQESPVSFSIRYSLQQDHALYARPLADPRWGSNHAESANSWLEWDGQKVMDSRATDGLSWTAPGTPWKNDHYTEAFLFVDLGHMRTIQKMTWLSGDANHSWLVDVSASSDGLAYQTVPHMQSVDLHKKWGLQHFPSGSPFPARFLKFRFHTGGQKQPVIRFPSELGVYDGVDDEKIALPQVGPEKGTGGNTLTLPARSVATVPLNLPILNENGLFFLGVEGKGAGHDWRAFRHLFGALPPIQDWNPANSRLGLNTSRPGMGDELKRLGIGWVRFENMKWPMVSPAEHRYAFDGSVAPWHVNTDDLLGEYAGAGLHILSYMFQTPDWCSSIPPDGLTKMSASFPPVDLALYGEFCFQVAARYGHTRVPADPLLTEDKKSGLGLVRYFEMWNEPNLNPTPTATWGPWAAPMDTYYTMMRHGAEAIKKADPTAMVTSAGYAGIGIGDLDRLRTFEYPDGKHPIDFVDVINVHYYSGQESPETATEDGNAGAKGNTTFVEDLVALKTWRDRYGPSKPIWMTETGYDSAGPFGTTEQVQAARLPRVVLLCLAHGVDRVFVYREIGSTPSMHACSGLLRNDLSRKPSWHTYGTLIRQLEGVEGGARRLPCQDESIWLLEWERNGQPLYTVWTVNGEASLNQDLGPCHVIDAFGGERKLTTTHDLKITPFPLYISPLKPSA